MSLTSFANTVHVWDKFYNRSSFDERSANEIYVYDIAALQPLYYSSPFSIKYVHQGSEYFKVNGSWQQVKAGQVLIINNESEVVCELREKAKSNRGLTFFLHPVLIEEVLHHNKIWPKDIPAYEQVPVQLPLFYDDVIERENDFQKFLKAQFLLINRNLDREVDEEYYYFIACELVKSQTKFLEKASRVQKVQAGTRKEIGKRVMKARELIYSISLDQFDLETIARECALSKYFLIRSFKQVYGFSPKQYFIYLKMERAKELLPTHSVEETATLLNYPHAFAFSKQFKITTRLSPSEFKKIC